VPNSVNLFELIGVAILFRNVKHTRNHVLKMIYGVVSSCKLGEK